MIAWVDSEHVGDKVTCCSRMGFLMYIQSLIIYWFSKKQGSVETSSFRSVKQCIKYVCGLRFNLRMIGVP